MENGFDTAYSVNCVGSTGNTLSVNVTFNVPPELYVADKIVGDVLSPTYDTTRDVAFVLELPHGSVIPPAEMDICRGGVKFAKAVLLESDSVMDKVFV